MFEIKEEYEGDKQDQLGAFYTPKVLIEKMYEHITEYVGKTFFDPTVGYGGLLRYALDKKIELGQDAESAYTEVYGVEIDPDVYEQCIKNFKEWANQHGVANPDTIRKHIVNCDFLDFDGFSDDGEHWFSYKPGVPHTPFSRIKH